MVIENNTNDIYFIEVKCHEICDEGQHKNILLKYKYSNAENLQKIGCTFDTSRIIKQSKKETLNYIGRNNQFLCAKDFGCDLKTTHFDFKQFLCHLMGILDYKKHNNKKLHFYYLFYKNNEYIQFENNNIYKKLEAELKTVFKVFGNLFPDIEFGYCYNDQFDTITNLEKEKTNE